MGLGWAPGGLMGVTIFFVISGYLINGLLVAEQRRTGTIDLKSFWLRRIRRLFPAIALAILGTVALCTLFDHVLLDKMRPDVLPSLFFFNNWWQVFRDVSYFEAAGSPSPLTHFWSLSIEEQFYVVWPLLLLLLHHFKVRKPVIVGIVAALAVVSGIEMALLYDPLGDPSRVYYGTDTRAVSLLIGVLLAFVWPSAAFGERVEVARRHGPTWIGFNIAGVVAIAGLVAVVVLTNGFSAFPYRGGIVLTSLLAAVLIAVLVVPKTWVACVLGLRPLVWIGKRSYGMYLWHFPILLLTTDANSTTGTPWWMHLIQLALIFAVSALSYTFVENPIRQGKLGQWWKNRKARPAGMGARVTTGCVAALVVVAAIGLFVVRPSDYAAQYAGNANEATSVAGESGQASQAGTATSGASQPDASMSTAYNEAFLTQHLNSAGNPLYDPLLIGDSVAAGAIGQFQETFPYGYIDAQVNRNIWESPYATYAEAGQVGDYVVFCLGTNNAVVDWQINDELLGSVPDSKNVLMVNTRTTQSWVQSTNEAIARAAETHPNVTIVDWYGASEGHDEYFAGDGTHLTPEGAHAYIQLIKDALAKMVDE